MSDGYEVGTAVVRRDSGKALLCDIDGVGEEWVPYSVIHDDSEIYEGAESGSGILVVSEWWADKQGWI